MFDRIARSGWVALAQKGPCASGSESDRQRRLGYVREALPIACGTTRSATGGTYPAVDGIDCVQELRRAAALARQYRDQEGLPIAEIAHRWDTRRPRSRHTFTTRPARRPERSSAATRASAAAAARRPRPDAVRATRTSTASAAVPARSRRPGRESGCATRCAPGERSTAARRRRRTGLALTRGGAVARCRNACATGIGRRRRRSSA